MKAPDTQWSYPAAAAIIGLAVIASAAMVWPGRLPQPAVGLLQLAGLVILAFSLLRIRRSWRRGTADARSKIESLSSVDFLTELPNRHAFLRAARRAIQRDQASGRPSALVTWTVTGLSDVNGRAGHSAGDAVMKSFARIVEESTRPTDLVARIGGAQFAAFLPGATAEPAARLAQRVVFKLEAMFQGRGLTASTAVAEQPRDAAGIDELLALTNAVRPDAPPVPAKHVSAA